MPPSSPENPATKRLALSARAFILAQHLIPQHAISRLVHALARVRVVWLKNLLIDAFMKGFSISLEEAETRNAHAYPSFNAFFTRALKPGARPLPVDPSLLVSPVDGTVSEIGCIDDDRLLQAKGRHYTLEALLAGHAEWARRFRGGHFATIYLAPYNYHRIHMPLDGALRGAWYVPGQLFSVNRVTADAVANLFARNERIVCMFRSPGSEIDFGLLLIGALNVGSMETVWHGEVAPRRVRQVTELEVGGTPHFAARGEEMGRFNMGSTVILLFPPGVIEWHAEIVSGKTLRMGQPIGRLLGSSR